jgi:nucleotide-binding universal stress UspA family protein
MFERVLVPLDGSPLAETILSQVRRILFWKDVEVLLLRAVELPPLFPGGIVGSRAAELEEAAKAYVRGQELKLREKGARVRSLVRIGPAAGVILEAAETERATLVAMTTHGRSGLSRWAFGSVAEKVLRASPVPLLLTRSFVNGASENARAASPQELQVQKILVPIEFSELSLEVLPYVSELGRLFNARVLLLNVCGQETACDVPVVEMTHAYENLREQGLAVEPLMRKGDPAEQILEASRELSVDFIAMTTHGRAGPSRWALGSVAEKVLRHAAMPVLLVRTTRTGSR